MLRAIAYGDADAVVQLLTRGRGRISAFVRGAAPALLVSQRLQAEPCFGCGRKPEAQRLRPPSNYDRCTITGSGGLTKAGSGTVLKVSDSTIGVIGGYGGSKADGWRQLFENGLKRHVPWPVSLRLFWKERFSHSQMIQTCRDLLRSRSID